MTDETNNLLKQNRASADSVTRIERTGDGENREAKNGSGGQRGVLPCPFCGHAPTVKNGKVKCLSETCKVQPRTQAWYCAGYETSAIADWNGRGGETPPSYQQDAPNEIKI